MEKYIKVLKELDNNPTIEQFDKSSTIDINIVKQLHEYDLIDTRDANKNTLGEPCYLEPRINLNGREWLESRTKNIKKSMSDDIIDIKPNIFGVGLNLNALWRKWFG